jgi:hypothetical protein
VLVILVLIIEIAGVWWVSGNMDNKGKEDDTD